MIIEVIQKDGLPLPEYKTIGSAGMDLMSAESLMLEPGEIRAISTGLYISLPNGYEGQVRSRSGMSLKGLVVNNAPGTVDSDYRGEVKVIIRNQNDYEVVITRGDRIAQLVIARVEQATLVPVNELNDTARGDGGFGSTGI